MPEAIPRKMFKFLPSVLLLGSAFAEGDKKEVGTVIGIYLGTTYSASKVMIFSIPVDINVAYRKPYYYILCGLYVRGRTS